MVIRQFGSWALLNYRDQFDITVYDTQFDSLCGCWVDANTEEFLGSEEHRSPDWTTFVARDACRPPLWVFSDDGGNPISFHYSLAPVMTRTAELSG
jgi:hypothetical protein